MPHKITKQQRLTLRKLALEMPTQTYASRPEVLMSGEDLNISGYAKGDKKFDPEKVYKIKSVEYNTVNHERRMVSAYQSNGVRGLFKYCRDFFAADKHLSLWQAMVTEFNPKLPSNEIPAAL